MELSPPIGGAFICERVLREEDGTLSAIRIVDRINHRAAGPEPPAAMPPLPLPLYIMVGIYGRADGVVEQTIAVRAEPPVGEAKEMGSFALRTETAGQPAWLVIALQFTALNEGLYWFVLSASGRELTRMPLRVEYSREVVAQADAGQS